jgi:hypothetical protein
MLNSWWIASLLLASAAATPAAPTPTQVGFPPQDADRKKF